MAKRISASIPLKLLCLAGIPVIGALILGLMLAHNVREQAKSAEALGTIEDLAQLSATMSGVIHTVQDERAQSALDLSHDPKTSTTLASARLRNDQSIASLNAFLATRSIQSLPARLSRDLASAVEALKSLGETRQLTDERSLLLIQLLKRDSQITQSLINATAGLTQLSNDGELLRNITMLVGALEVSERISREQALLANVLEVGKFPPGTFREFVTLGSEQQDYINVLRSNATDEQIHELDQVLASAEMTSVARMRVRAQDLGEVEDAGVRTADWFGAEAAVLRDMRQLEGDLASKVRAVAANKIVRTKAALRTSLGLSVAILFFAASMAILIARGINRSVGSLAQAAAEVRRNNDYSVQAVRTSNDELGVLTDAFNQMLADIRIRDEDLANHRQNLERLVESRTLELAQRNREMRVVLDAVEQGLVTVLPDGSLGQQQSQAFGAWFPESAGHPFFEVLAPDDHTKLMLRLGWESVMEDVLPLEVCLDQMKKDLVIDDRHFSLAYRPILEADKLLAVLLSVTDVTSEVARKRSEAQQLEFIVVFEHIMKDKNGFIEFFNETSRIINLLDDANRTDDPVLLRQVHTLKGNSSVYGITSVAELCHELETLALEEGVATMRLQLKRLSDKWLEFARRIVPLLGQKSDNVIEIQYNELETIVDLVKQLPQATAIVAQLNRLKHEPTTVRFERAAEQAKSLAKRLRKGEISCVIDGGGVRLPAERWSPFFQSLIHVVRNAVDHGLEPESERVANGKSPTGTLTFRSREAAGNFLIEIEDDGRGIDWAQIENRAAAKGLPTDTRAALIRALFTDGITTLDSADVNSGRGVGMAAVEQAVRALSGHVDVRSTSGKGSTFIFRFPVLGNEHAPSDSRFPGARPSLQIPSRMISS